jgi:hypothetical protein
MRPAGARHRRSAVVGAVACGWAALSAWQGTVFRNTPTARWTTLGVVAAALLAAGLAGRGRQRETSPEWARRASRALGGSLADGAVPAGRVAGAVGWVLLITATIAWDLVSFIAASPQLPTLSRLVGDVTEHPWGRAVVFAGWLALGAYLALGWRRSPADRP